MPQFHERAADVIPDDPSKWRGQQVELYVAGHDSVLIELVSVTSIGAVFVGVDGESYVFVPWHRIEQIVTHG